MKKLLLVLFFTMFPVLAHGATYYVATTGSDSNSCSSTQSQSTPKLTINAGINCLSGGDTLIVKSGTYAERIDDTIPSGSSGNPTTIQAEVRGGAILSFAITNTDPLIRLGISQVRQWITLDGLVLDGQNATGGGINFRSPDGTPDGSASHHLTIQNMEIKNIANWNACSTGINTSGMGINGNFMTIRNTHVHDVGTGAIADPGNCPSGQHIFYSYCIYFSAADSLVENNELDHCSSYGIHNYHGAGRNIFRNNYIHHNGGPVLLAAGGDNAQFYNNILANNGGFGGGGGLDVGSFGGAASINNQIYNNTIYKNLRQCIGLGTAGASGQVLNTIVRNNICWQNEQDGVFVNNGSGNVIDHNLVGQDPLFINAAGGDFHLQNGSPAIEAGVVISGLSYRGSAPDLGALETGAGGQLPAPINLKTVGN